MESATAVFYVPRHGRALALAISILAATARAAEVPRVVFDMPYSVACRDATSPEFAAANPSEKLIEAKFAISSLLESGREEDLRQYFFRVENPSRTMRVVDYLPKSGRESRVAGNVGIHRLDESNATAGLNLSGHYPPFTGASANTGLGQKRQASVKFDLLPALQTVTASGTILRGSGVYFKFKASPRHLLEGQQLLALALRVPRSWRAGYVWIHCEAEGIVRGVVPQLDQRHPAGQRDFLVALYLEGDAQAQQAAEAFARSEAALRTAARIKEREIQERAHPTFARQLGAVFEVAEPAIPENWLAQLLYGDPSLTTIPKPLPREVVQAAQDFVASREALLALSR